MKLKGPELKKPNLKMPELKAPAFLADLFYDLRDRRLLPLVALVAVAIVAVPFLLGGDAEELPPPLPPAESAAPESSGAKSSSLTVVEATPGLRDYRKRLRGRAPTDPFEQRYADAPGGSGSGSGGDAVTSSTTTTSSESTSVTVTGSSDDTATDGGSSPGSPGGAPSGNSSPPSQGGGGLVFYAFAIDVRISRSGGDGADSTQAPEPTVKHRVLPQTPLPGEKAPVVTYMGPSRDAAEKQQERVLLLVSGDVRSISGEGRCASRGEGEVCQMLEVEPGFPVTFVYGANEVLYTVKVLKVELVVTGRG